MSETAAEAKAGSAVSAWTPFTHAAFAVLWTATVISNVGTWMHDVASGWLMTSLSPSPLMVALVQAATTAPVFLFALGAGALADLVDRRRLLIGVMGALALATLALGLLVLFERIDAWVLLVFTFLSGAGAAFVAPAWQAIVPQLVPRSNLQAAVALNSVGINISRAVGPALAGVIIAGLGIAWPYLLSALSFIIVIAALLWWRPPPPPATHLPSERFWRAVRTGLGYAWASGPLRATLVRAAVFFVFASAYWALLPLFARQELAGGPELYGVMLGAIGVGAVSGALSLPPLKQRLGADALVAAGTAGTALALVIFALLKHPEAAILACLIAGASWIAVLSSLNVSAQVALPDWVRARGLSVFITVFFGSMTFGSLVWGQVASLLGIPAALLIAAVAAVVGAALSWPFKLQQGLDLDLSPSSHWPEPIVAGDIQPDRGPVMVTVDYRIDPVRATAFIEAMNGLKAARLRNGAYAWGLFEDVAEPGRYLEYFIEASWLAHLRHHARVTEADRVIQDKVRAFQREAGEPLVTHFLAPDPAAVATTRLGSAPRC
ncbi:MFS transporter [Exilibacterium tricleocarpae]|uniref:MFS transporter n=1 Tax=Exilibacterium tricleocarpae TaxID=2591008 RepID=A0A545TLI7_9GAMM|nr:MFS transporter [Exilibacterium tricleocarpae]TQV78031.1 MFS transporter [Exilibacterium tricleocarpae]